MKCLNCGQEIPQSAKVCGYCGARQEKKPETKACPNCQSLVPAGAKVCGECGHRFSSEASTPITSEPEKPAVDPARLIQEEKAAPTKPIEEEKQPESLREAPRAVPPQKAPKPAKAGMKLSPAVIMGGVLLLTALAIGAYFLFFAANAGTLLYDDFSNPASGWSVFTNENAQVGYADGDYRINFLTGTGFQAGWSLKQYTDCVIETEIAVPVGSQLGGGLTFRALSETAGNWYLFFVYPDTGDYSFFKTVGNQWTDSVVHRPSSAITQAVQNGSFRLKAVVQGGQFDFYISGPDGEYTLLASLTDSDLEKGYLGPSADSFGGPDVRNPGAVTFRWIRVSKVE
jgi:RNA polymerase subunit RPABC4/transcription elongation factor Spt4